MEEARRAIRAELVRSGGGSNLALAQIEKQVRRGENSAQPELSPTQAFLSLVHIQGGRSHWGRWGAGALARWGAGALGRWGAEAMLGREPGDEVAGGSPRPDQTR